MLDLTKPFYPLFFSALKNHPEAAHNQLMKTLSWLNNSHKNSLANWLKSQLQQSFGFHDIRLSQKLWNLDFPNPFGLAAGFDKDALAAGIWHSFGFGFAELGAVTLEPQPGNPRPRLFRLPADKAVLNRMGANNDGAAIIAKRLQQTWTHQPRTIPIGINLCKSKVTPLEAAATDYLESFRYLKDVADYFVVNVSSPNTPGLRNLQAEEQLKPIFDALQAENQGEMPLFVKIAPDLEFEAIASILALTKTYNLSGVIATNTTIRRDLLQTEILPTTGNPITEEAGGISGAPLKQRSTEVIKFIYQQTQGKLPIIGVGGIFTAEDAWEKITAGATLFQVYTGWLYEGPWMLPTILKGLLDKLDQHGLTHISQAVGLNSL